MSEWLFKFLGKLQQFYEKQAWSTKPIYHLLEKVIPTKTEEDMAWITDCP